MSGWIALQGAQRYPHPGPDVTALPDSAWFSFSGSVGAGWTVRSEANDLCLDVDPLVDRLPARDTSTFFVMRSAPAPLMALV